MKRTIQGIFFDLGYTLLDFGPVDTNSLFAAGAKLAYEYLRELGMNLPGFSNYRRRNFWAIRWAYLKSRLTRREFNSLDLLKKLSTAMGHKLTHEQAVETAWRYYLPLREQAYTENGLRSVLESLHDQNLKLGVISNTFVPGEVLDRHLQQEQLLDLLPIRVYSCDVGVRKPNPRIFQEALRRANLPAEATMFVGDSPRQDVGGANLVGMISVLKDPTGRYDRSSVHPRHRIRKLTELPEIVAQYNGR